METPITSLDELRELVGEPIARAVYKERPALHELDRQWLAQSPFCLIATADAEGRCDVSPKGDPAGFTHILDDRTIVLPDRPGNRRVDGFRNVLENPRVGLIYLLPGRGDTLRINGKARLVRDAPYFDELIVKGHRPRLALVVDIEEVFHHCSKAFLRSALWKPETWAPDAVPSRSVIAKTLEMPEATIAELDEYYGPSYAAKLYTP
ncbi:pyridoxamine 5'-phosphate oxidase family protein [Amycolatopsis nigrescens]|uniref:pyridoxamine 5'-phosphate oxidase family protein n=1 Tax=Amycolatopsis nigrescens TaxID=381445 RepID=UPI0003634D1D|nr:pyridoxamine 5'-phosphate oxidase family protein [Amycolatopsis nigrescens]